VSNLDSVSTPRFMKCSRDTPRAVSLILPPLGRGARGDRDSAIALRSPQHFKPAGIWVFYFFRWAHLVVNSYSNNNPPVFCLEDC